MYAKSSRGPTIAIETKSERRRARPRRPKTTSGPPPRGGTAPGARALALEGTFQSLAQGLGETYLGAFALALGAGGFTLGLVAALPTSATALGQAVARRAGAGARSARAFIAGAWSLQAVGYGLLGLCAFLPAPWSVAGLCALIALGWGCGGAAVPSWTSLVSRTIAPARHGWFFGLRGAAQQVGVLVAILGGGFLLARFEVPGFQAGGYLVLFVLAGVARLAGTTLLTGVAQVGSSPAASSRWRGFEGLTSSAKLRRLAYYLWVLHFATHIATPFFVPYMLADLRLSYAQVGLLLSVPAIVKIGTVRMWGRLADRIGPGPLLRRSGWLVAPVPALWLFSRSPWWILVAQVASGLVWGVFELAQASALLQTTRGRPGAITSFNVVDGGAILAGSLTGGAIVRLSEMLGSSGYTTAMACSALLRALPAGILLWRVRDIGRPRWSHLRMPLRLWAIRPTRGMSLRPWEEIPPEPEAGEGDPRGNDTHEPRTG